ncbi:N-acyl homoserine lactonase family protein [Kiloniella sp.]|uniref:N-acyl homoserine lactonase family protein n=1 Tax=Kiloniella sp. TaxID=1938587 RepID=UPI003B021957
MKNTLIRKMLVKGMLGASISFLLSIGTTQAAPKVIGVDTLLTNNTELQLYVFECGNVSARDLSLFNPAITKGTAMEMVAPCYLIKHPKGTLFWDGGLSDSLNTEPNGVEFYEGAFNFSVSKTLISQLEEIRVKPKDVDYLALSHLHADHVGNANYFANSTWLVQENEHTIAFSENAQDYGFHIDDYIGLKDSETMKLNGDHDVFGDGSVVILSTPGHSPGHQVLWVNLPQTGPVILSGDLYHFQENRDNYGIPVWNSKKETIQSFVKIDNILDKTNAQLWIEHDKPTFDSLIKSPAFYQ